MVQVMLILENRTVIVKCRMAIKTLPFLLIKYTLADDVLHCVRDLDCYTNQSKYYCL